MESGNWTSGGAAIGAASEGSGATAGAVAVITSTPADSAITDKITSGSEVATSKLTRMEALDTADPDANPDAANTNNSEHTNSTKTNPQSVTNTKKTLNDETTTNNKEDIVTDSKTLNKEASNSLTKDKESKDKEQSSTDSTNTPHAELTNKRSQSPSSSSSGKHVKTPLPEASPLVPGVSKKVPPGGRRYSSTTTASPERPPLAGARKLSIQPRTTQYEPNLLLQGYNEHGKTMLEELFAERLNLDSKLQPRTEQCERSGLLERNASGLTELEMYLQEREKEMNRNRMKKASSVDSTGSSSAASARRQLLLRQQSMPEARPRLEPRTSQFEQHALLAEKDGSGMSILDAFLAEKENDFEQGSDNGSITSKGKCSEKCTCKNANCHVCKGPKSAYSTPSSSGSHPPLIKKESSRETVIEPKQNNKRVHFSESGEEEEDEEEGGNGGQEEDGKKSPSANTKSNNNQYDNNVLPDKTNKCKAKAKKKCVIS